MTFVLSVVFYFGLQKSEYFLEFTTINQKNNFKKILPYNPCQTLFVKKYFMTFNNIWIRPEVK